MNFYDRHPISEQQVLAAVARRRGGDLARLTPDDLFEFDQDHYGGLKAVDDVARRAGITAASRVLDVCAGLAGPARFLASRRGCRVLALELHAGPAPGAPPRKRLGEARVREYEQLYAFFVGLVEDGKLGGGRLSGSA